MDKPFWQGANRIVLILCIVVIVAMAAGVGAPVSAVSPPPTYVTQWGSPGGLPGPGIDQFYWPTGIAVNASGYVYVVDDWNNRIKVFTPSGGYVTQWGQQGTLPGQFEYPYGIAVNASGYVYVTDINNERIQEFDPSGNNVTYWGSNGSSNRQFYTPSGIAVNASGYVYVTDTGNSRIEVFTPSGGYVTKWGSLWWWGDGGTGIGQFMDPYGIAVNASGYVYVTDTGNSRIEVFDPSGRNVTHWGSTAWIPTPGSNTAQIHYPTGIAVSPSGYVYVADTLNNTILEFDPSGTNVTQWGSPGGVTPSGSPGGIAGYGNGQFFYPYGIAVNASGYVYVTDTNNNRVEVFSPTPVVTPAPIWTLTRIPTFRTPPPTTTNSPGFNALIALIGLGAVAFIIVRRH
jgi:PGF-CTERM protein